MTFRRNDPVHIVNTIEKKSHDDLFQPRMQYLNGTVKAASLNRTFVNFGENSPYPDDEVWVPNKYLFKGHAPEGAPMYERKPL